MYSDRFEISRDSVGVRGRDRLEQIPNVTPKMESMLVIVYVWLLAVLRLQAKT